jgi:hypothetical protein
MRAAPPRAPPLRPCSRKYSSTASGSFGLAMESSYAKKFLTSIGGQDNIGLYETGPESAGTDARP